MAYESFLALKYVASGAKNLSQVIKTLKGAIEELETMHRAGVEIDLQNIEDGHIAYYTGNAKIAKKYGFHKVEREEEIEA